MKFKLWLENELSDLYQKIEPTLLGSREIQQELAAMGYIKISTVEKVLGVLGGVANFAAREFNKRHRNEDQERVFNKKREDAWMRERRDDYYYHVLPKARLKSVLSKGLMTDQDATFSNYGQHSRGRIFLCEKEGVNFWKERVEQHLFHNGLSTQVVVIRIKKDLVPKVSPDTIGTQDSHTPSYYTMTSIPPQGIEVMS